MNQLDVELLQQIQGYPAVSLIIPTHRTSPDNQQDPIRVKNLVTETKNRFVDDGALKDHQRIALITRY